MRLKAVATSSIAITMLCLLPAIAQPGDKSAQPGKQKSAAASRSESIPWPFTINPNGFKIVKGQRIQFGKDVPAGTSVTVEAQNTDDPAHRFVAQLTSDNWTITDMPEQKGVRWGKTATRGPWEAVIVSESSKATNARKRAEGKVAQTVSDLWRTRLEVRLAKNYDGSQSPVKEFRVAPE